MGHAEMWRAMRERDAIYANPEASEDDFMRAAEFEAKLRGVRRLRLGGGFFQGGHGKASL